LGLLNRMKSALLAAIFGITGGVAILLAVPAEETAPIIKIQPPKWFPDYGEPMVPQIEETPPQEVLVPEPSDHYVVAQTKTEKPAPRRHMHENVVRPATQQPVTKTVKRMCLVVESGSRIPQPCDRLAAIPTTANPMTIYGHRPGR
jgi:hypothetical protein